jgi:2OG-Fe(II) oxygenase superfamily
MQALNSATLETFLPLPRMQEIAASAAVSYRRAKPFPHIIFDDFFEPQLLDAVLGEFPAPGKLAWRSFKNQYEVKLFSSAETTFGAMTRLLLYHLNGITFLNFLSQVTGIENLIPDPTFNGGGMHQIEPGGKLGIHADFNKLKGYDLDRRLNALIYLNKDWREEYGGHLELWDQDMTRCEVKALPIFNRMVVFSTTDFSYHGHPEPLRCPQGMTRKSLALYYYTNGRPKHEISAKHSTQFRERQPGEFGPVSLRKRVRALFKNIPHRLRGG